jgi:hypothetical protein
MSEQLDLLELATRGGPPHERAVAALTALTDLSADQALHWPLSVCDAHLLELYRSRYGRELRAVSACPECGELLELGFAVDDLLAALSTPDRSELMLDVDGYELELRLPTVADLGRAQRAADLERAQQTIAAGCVCACVHQGAAVSAADLPAPVLERVEQQLGRFDLGADGIELSCPACAARWSATLDVATLVLAELDAEGQRLLADIHILARAYGWSEAEIVDLPPGRRRKYVEMVLG